MEWILLAVGWIVCGVPAYGLTLAYFHREFPQEANESDAIVFSFAVLIGALGPAGLIITFIKSSWGKHGLMWRQP